MAVRYARSTDGNNADSGATWALAKATIAGLDAIDTTGDTLWLSQVHAESTAGAVTVSFVGNTKLLCGNDAAEPPTALATGATVTTTGNNNITVGVSGQCYGVTFQPGFGASGTASFSAQAGSSQSTFTGCTFDINSTGASSKAGLADSSGLFATYVNCSFKFGASGQSMSNASGTVAIKGGSLLAGGTSPTTLFSFTNNNVTVTMDGFDLSNASSSINIASTTVGCISFTMRDCALPASWTGSLNASTPGAGSVFEMFNCDSGDTHYHYRKAAAYGTIQDETTNVRTGGANDGNTTFSYKMVSNSSAAANLLQTLDTREFVVYNAAVGSAKTATIEILRDSVTALKDTEIWAEVMYLGTNGKPLAAFADDAAAGVAIAAGAAQDASTRVPRGPPRALTNPNKQKLRRDVHAAGRGVRFTCACGSPRRVTTLYLDPKPQKSW
jgi:hypothetical protein